ncbi:MAG: hypothetical protein FWE11_00640 [Defluviitaleaceae bacterium]|nr:hypothetical protein [Defluviitaleaceae bacterium]
MKRIISSGTLCAILLVLLLAFGACSTTEPEVALAPGEAFSMAVADMREAREAASVLGAFTSFNYTEEFPQQVFTQLMYINPVDLEDAPTRSHFTVLLDSLTIDGEAVVEAMLLRPGLNITGYSHNNFRYIESGISLMGLPFDIMNIGIDGPVASVQVPLLYDRYFAIDVEELAYEMADLFMGLEEMGMIGQEFTHQLELQEAMMEAFAYAFDIEVLLLDILGNMLEVAEVETDGVGYTMVVSAHDATKSLHQLWNGLLTMLEAVDFDAIDPALATELFHELPMIYEELIRLHFTQDVVVGYSISQGVLLGIEVEGVLSDGRDEIRMLVVYNNLSGDHVGQIKWTIELEDLVDPWLLSMEIYSSLNEENGFSRKDEITIHFADRWDEITLGFGWHVDRTIENRFYVGLDFSLDDGFDIFSFEAFAQGAKAVGDNFFTLDMDRLGFGIDSTQLQFEIVLGAFFRHEAIDIALLPTIDPANQLFVMDATPEEMDAVLEQIQSNIEGLTTLFGFLGF